MNAINSYMFMNRLSKFVRLRLEGDDTFIAFYGVNSSKIHVRAESSRLSGLSNHSGHSGRASPERGGRASPERGGRASPERSPALTPRHSFVSAHSVPSTHVLHEQEQHDTLNWNDSVSPLSLRDVPSGSSYGCSPGHHLGMSLEVPRTLNFSGMDGTHSPSRSASNSLSDDHGNHEHHQSPTHQIGGQSPSPRKHKESKKRKSVSISVEVVVEKLRAYNDQKRRAKARRKERERRIYELIKKQSILSGIVAVSDALTWIPSMFVSEADALTLILGNSVIGVICVYLTFTFSRPCFDCCCKRFVDNCTCIEDHIEKQLAHKMQMEWTLQEMENELQRNEDRNEGHLELGQLANNSNHTSEHDLTLDLSPAYVD